MSSELRARRELAGLSQAQLADRSGVSRQLIATAEAGRHVPAVDAAMKIARALGTTVEELFAESAVVPAGVVGPLSDGVPVVAARVGDRAVAHPAALTGTGPGWSHPDGVVREGVLQLFSGASLDGLVLVGCDPAIELAATALGGVGPRRLLSVAASSGAAREALAAGRCHAVIVHSPLGTLPEPPVAVARWRFARWQVGLALPAGAGLDDALEGHVPSVQREQGAASQQALARAAKAHGVELPAPVATSSSHLDSVRIASAIGVAAVTYEPAAYAAGLSFAPLETHEVELWIAVEYDAHPGAVALCELVAGSGRLRDRMAALGGYDLIGMGEKIT